MLTGTRNGLNLTLTKLNCFLLFVLENLFLCLCVCLILVLRVYFNCMMNVGGECNTSLCKSENVRNVFMNTGDMK